MVSEKDWELLSAYRDGELPAEDSALLEGRMNAEPQLMEALEQIQGVGVALSALRPQSPEVDIPVQPAGQKVHSWRPLAVAASFAATVLVAGSLYLLPMQNRPFSPTDWHHSFLQQPFQGDGSFRTMNVRSLDNAGAPDLSGANLTLVADEFDEARIRALHYAGENGCRLTLTISVGAAPVIETETGLLLASWSVSSSHYTLLSTGMDEDKFAAITRFLRFFAEQQHQPDTIVAMQDATQNAVPCA